MKLILHAILILGLFAFMAQSQSCPLIEYADPLFYSDEPIRIHPDFKPHLDAASSAAKDCSVIVYFKKSFVKDDGKFLGTVPASARKPYSNHFIGHAVNFVVSKKAMPLRFCRPDCLNALELPSHVKCFMDKILANGWRWGKAFNDTTHYDDSFNVKSESKYNDLRKSMQAACSA